MHPPQLLSLNSICQVCHHFDPPPLPPNWVAVPHLSGATVYLHKPTRVVTLSRPYHVSTSNSIKVGWKCASIYKPLPLSLSCAETQCVCAEYPLLGAVAVWKTRAVPARPAMAH